MLATIGQVAHFAVGLTGNPLAIIGLVPIFAAGLAFMRYVTVDPESHPVDVRHVCYLDKKNPKVIGVLGSTRI